MSSLRTCRRHGDALLGLVPLLVPGILPSNFAQGALSMIFEPLVDAVSMIDMATLSYRASALLRCRGVPHAVDAGHHVVVLANGALRVRFASCGKEMGKCD